MESTSLPADLAYRHFLYTGALLAAIPVGVAILGEGWWYAAYLFVPLAGGTAVYGAWMSRQLRSDRRLALLSNLTYAFFASFLLDVLANALGWPTVGSWILWTGSIALAAASLGYGLRWLATRRAPRLPGN